MDRNETGVRWFAFGDNDTVFFIDKRIVAAGAKFNLRRGNGSSHNVVNDYSSDGDLCRINKSGCFSSAVEVDRDASCVSFTTVNILALIYKRIDPQALAHKLIYYASLLTAIRKECLRVMDYKKLLFNDCGNRVAQLLHVQSVTPFVQNPKGSVPQEFLIVNSHLLFPHDSSMCIVRLNEVYQILQYVELYQRENRLKSMPIILCGTRGWNLEEARFGLGLIALGLEGSLNEICL
ncbi:hypothetical protein JHK87_007001 [Glycine soja]|nr:hypothetical protein JHK87_007001 [Glycine soja]